MLYLYQSDRLESLSELLSAVVGQPQGSVLAPETVIVQSKGMGRWITLQLARRHGVCANMSFPLPASFIWQLARQVVGNLPEHSPFAPELMSWRLYTVLPEVAAQLKEGQPEKGQPAESSVAGYLEADNPARTWRLAKRVADSFDQYLVYRPEWIAAWERGELCGLGAHEAWQASLWRAMSQGRLEPHRAEVISTLLERLRGSEPLAGLPERVVLFAVSSLPPVMMEIIEALGQRMDVCLFALNPCEAEWGQITDRREMARLSQKASLDDDLFLDIGNPLLASLGKQGRDFFDEIHARFPELVSLFEEQQAPPASLLEVLQQDILTLVDREQTAAEVLPAADHSLQIHVCHSPMRELEVLHDQLLALFERQPDLQPDQVVVLLPAIGDYAPYIDAVFAPQEGEPSIHYSIADRGMAEQNPLLEVFATLLTLPDSRFEAEWVMGLLDHPAVLRRFGLGGEDLPMIRRWIADAGIRWGRDAAHKASLGLPPDPGHTWQEGLGRLLLGYALPTALAGGQVPLFAGQLPCDDVEGSRSQVLGNFAGYYQQLAEWAEQLTEPVSPADWNQRLNRLLEDFFQPDPEEEEMLVQLRDDLELLLRVEEAGYCQQPVEAAVIASWLNDLLQQPGGAGGFLSGGVTFCTLVPMRSLPFRVICLLGLNDGAFPRGDGPAGFDLISQHPRRGDRSRRFDDRYLFLETILSARETLYISYVGQDIRDNTELPPSVLVSELMDVAARSVEFADGTPVLEHIVTQHALQPFDARYFQGQARFPGFSRHWCEGACRLQQPAEPVRPLMSDSLPAFAPSREVDVEEFLRFFRHPVRFFLQQQLGVRLELGEDVLAGEELFTLRDQFLLRQELHLQLLEARRHAWNENETRELIRASGQLPPGGIGKAVCQATEQGVSMALPHLLPLLEAPLLPPVPVHFQSDGITLTGWLRDVTAEGLFLIDARRDEKGSKKSEPSALNQLDLWLRHLLLCEMQPDRIVCQSQLHTLDSRFRFAAVENSGALLGSLLRLYLAGQQRGLPFFPKSALAFAESWHEHQDVDKAMKQARSKWNPQQYAGSNFYPESDNPYYQLFYRGLDPLGDPEFAELAEMVMLPLVAARQAMS